MLEYTETMEIYYVPKQKETLYKQCRLEKTLDTGTEVQVAWIPSSVAVVGKSLALKGADGEWDAGWVVMEAHSMKLSEGQLMEQRNEQRGWRCLVK